MRDLDDLLDPVVSRRASAAARTPDFEAVERRGRQRRRRARAAAAGAVVAVAAAVSVVGTQVASYRSDTAPAGTIEWDGPDGELARVVESGKAESTNVGADIDGSLLTTWSHFGPIIPDVEQSPTVLGVSMSADDKTYWSPLEFQYVDVAGLGSDGFVVALQEKDEKLQPLLYYVAGATGMRALELTEGPADLTSGDYDGYAWIYAEQTPKGAIYAVDIESATAAPVSELAGISPAIDSNTQVPQTADGELWVVADRPNQPPELVHMAPDAQLSTYALPPGPLRNGLQGSVKWFSVSHDGRPILLWADGELDPTGPPYPPRPLMLTTLSASGELSTEDLGNAPVRSDASAAALSDGRLLVANSRGLLRSTDESWDDFEPIAAPDGVPARRLGRYALTETDDSVCIAPSLLGGGTSGTAIPCTADGDTWNPVDLTP